MNKETNCPEKKSRIFQGKQFCWTKTMQILVVCLSFCAISSFAGQITTKKSNYKIIIPDNPSKVCLLASSELSVMLEKTYDAAPISFNGSSEPIVFYVGVSGEAILAEFADLPDIHGKFGVFKKGRNILLYGWDDEGIDPEKSISGEAGTLLAVYYFLNKYVGTTFYFPGENGYAVTKNQAITMNDESDIPSPSFVLRGFSLKTKEYSQTEKLTFFRRSLCSIPRWGQNDIYYVYMNNWKKRFMASHPEYFMLKGGKRISERYPYHVPCFSNPDVLRQTAADIVEDINKNPSKTTVRIFCDAPISLCQCANCLAMPEREYCNSDSSEAVYGFQKKIADIVHQTHPKIYFLTQTKGHSYYKVPQLTKLGDLFTIRVLTTRHLTNINAQSFALETAKKWYAAGVRTNIFSYPRYNDKPTKNMPVITPRFTAEYLKAFNGLTSGTATSELNFNPYSFSALNQFIQAKLLFNVNTDIDKLIREFCAFAYPGAEDEMIEFYNEMEKLYRQRQNVHLDPFKDIYHIDNLEKPMQILDSASKKIKGNTVFYNNLYADFKSFYERSLNSKSDKMSNINKERPSATSVSFDNKTGEIPSLSDPIWNKTVPLKTFYDKENGLVEDTVVSVLNDDNNLYVRFDCKQTGEIVAKNTLRDEYVSDDDFIEIFINPTGNSIYKQFVINPAGVVYDGKGMDRSWNSKIKSIQGKSSAGWYVVAQIPFKDIDPELVTTPQTNTVWGVNFCRARTDKIGTPQGSLSWAPTYGNFHDTERFGNLIFGRQEK